MDLIRGDILWLLPAIGIAVFQVKVLWQKLPEYKSSETEIEGDTNHSNALTQNYLKYSMYLLLISQISYIILPITNVSETQHLVRLAGYILILYGFLTSYKATKALGNNWTGMPQFRIKKGQRLVTEGIYKKIRHPIYAATIFEIVGFELVANSWLFFILLILCWYYFYKQAKKEESLLTKKYTDNYLKYKSSSYYFFPYIF